MQKYTSVAIITTALFTSSLNAQDALESQSSPATAESATPGYNHKIPEKIMTPDKVETRLGTLSFVDGIPTDETTEVLFDNLDHLRGVEVFLNFVPAASIEGLRLGGIELGASKSNQAVIFDELCDSAPLLLTPNTETVYCLAFIDLMADGPTVVEIPAKCGPGTVNDAFFRFVTDMGAPGPDKGEGGKYLIVPDWYTGELPKDKKDGGEYFISRTSSAFNMLILRGFLVDGKPDVSSKMFRDGLKVYSLSKADAPPAMEFIKASKIPFNTVHANDFEFFEELNHVIQREPLGTFDPELRGLAATIGIVKGKPFAPDARMKKILEDSVAVGNATARAISFKSRDPRAPIFPNSKWETGFIGSDYRWLNGDGMAGRNIDARARFFYVATVNTPAMAAKIPGKGSQYAISVVDSSNIPFDGGKNYTMNVPANAPAKDFWSVVVYDPQTRSELQTEQPFPSKNNKRNKLITNADGSTDLYFGPKPPEGKEANWTQTVPGKGWFGVFRLYGPLEPWFDKSWKPGEIEPVN